jgi:hypothetical protein
VLLVFYALYLLASVLGERRQWRVCAGMLAFSAVLFVIQQHTAQIGQRYRLPVINNIVLRVLPHPEYVRWFERHGMPDVERLTKRFSAPVSDPSEIYPLYWEPEFARFSAWAASEGRTVYVRFLLTHPENLLLLNEKESVRKRMQAYNFGYVGPPRGFSRLVHNYFPRRPERVLLLFAILLFICFREKSRAWILPAILGLTFTFNAFLVFWADSLEVQRHEFLTMTMAQFLGVMTLSLILDTNLVSTWQDRFQAWVQERLVRKAAG